MNIITDVLFPFLVLAILFGLGLTLSIDDFKRVLAYPRAVIVGLSNQLILLPLVGFVVAYLFSVGPEFAVGLVIIAAAPGGPFSNVITHLLKADTALSVTLTALSSLVVFITIPLWVGLALNQFMHVTESVSWPLARFVVKIAAITIVPVALGLLVCRRWPGFSQKMVPSIRIGSSVLIVVAIAAFLIDQRQSLGNLPLQSGLVAGTLCISTILLGYFSSRLFGLKPSARVTIAVETGLQNIPLALTTAATLLGNPRLAVPTAAYGLISIFLMALVLISVVMRIPILGTEAGDR